VCQSVSCNQQRRPRRTVHGLYKSYTGLEARVESLSQSQAEYWGPCGHPRWTVIWRWLSLGQLFVTEGQKRDYLSRASQRARGATKNWNWTIFTIFKQKINCTLKKRKMHSTNKIKNQIWKTAWLLLLRYSCLEQSIWSNNDTDTNSRSTSANAEGPCDAASCKINHIVLHAECKHQTASFASNT